VSGRILIIDDEPANVLLLEAYLADTASEIRGLTDSHHAEQAFEEFEPDICPSGLAYARPGWS
jgi:PleD family two-component response regulator